MKIEFVQAAAEGEAGFAADNRTVVRPVADSFRGMAEQFCRLGKERGDGCDILLDIPGISPETKMEAARLLVQSLYQGAYRFRRAALKELAGKPLFPARDSLADYGNGVYRLFSRDDLTAAVAKGEEEGRLIGYARSLGNLPSNYLGTEEFTCYAAMMAEYRFVRCQIIGEQELSRMGCGGILSINQGMSQKVAMAVLTYEGAPGTPYTALIGKGVFFDSGGYHLKSMADMEGMKFDMCGAAGMLEAFEAIAAAKVCINLMAVLPLAENLIGPGAVRMGDVAVMMSGKTVEIYNTDAEGRLLLADALTYAQSVGTACLIDLATLTYSCRNALGDSFTGGFCNDDGLWEAYCLAADSAGEPVWRLPLDDSYHRLLARSDCADLANYAPGTGGGASVAACFLEEFVREGQRWIHLDAVGPSVIRQETEGMAKGASGANIASVIRFLEGLGAEKGGSASVTKGEM